MNICESPTVAEASAKGDALGWKRVNDEKWHRALQSGVSGTLEDVGWQSPGNESESIAFWTVTGKRNSKVCTYNIEDAAGILEALIRQFGAGSRDMSGALDAVSWQQGAMHVLYVHVGSVNRITISEN